MEWEWERFDESGKRIGTGKSFPHTSTANKTIWCRAVRQVLLTVILLYTYDSLVHRASDNKTRIVNHS